MLSPAPAWPEALRHNEATERAEAAAGAGGKLPTCPGALKVETISPPGSCEAELSGWCWRREERR